MGFPQDTSCTCSGAGQGKPIPGLRAVICETQNKEMRTAGMGRVTKHTQFKTRRGASSWVSCFFIQIHLKQIMPPVRERGGTNNKKAHLFKNINFVLIQKPCWVTLKVMAFLKKCSQGNSQLNTQRSWSPKEQCRVCLKGSTLVRLQKS